MRRRPTVSNFHVAAGSEGSRARRIFRPRMRPTTANASAAMPYHQQMATNSNRGGVGGSQPVHCRGEAPVDGDRLSAATDTGFFGGTDDAVNQQSGRAPPLRPAISKFLPARRGSLHGLVLACRCTIGEGDDRRIGSAVDGMAADDLRVSAAGCRSFDRGGRGVHFFSCRFRR